MASPKPPNPLTTHRVWVIGVLVCVALGAGSAQARTLIPEPINEIVGIKAMTRLIEASISDEAAPISHISAPAVTTYRGMGNGNVERWRDLTSRYFKAGDVDRALCLMVFESGGNPDARNPSSGASGLMQVMPFWAGEFGYLPGDLFVPAVNLEVAARIRAIQGWTAWSPYKRGECR